MVGQTRTKERPQYNCNITAFTGKNELLSEKQMSKRLRIYTRISSQT